MSRFIAYALFSAFLVTALSPGASAQAAGQALTLKDCIDTALQNNPDLSGLQNSYDSGRAKYLQARGSYYPQLSASASESRRVQPLSSLFGTSFTSFPGLTDPIDTTSYSYGLSLQQNIWDFGKTSSVIKQAALNRDLSYCSLERKKQEIIYSVKKSYYGYLSAKAVQDTAQLNVKDMQALFDSMKERREQGLATPVDVLNAESELITMQASLKKAGYDQDIAVVSLVNVLGKDLQGSLSLAEEKLPDPAEKPLPFSGYEEVRKLAVAQRIEFQEMDLREKLAQAGVTAAYGDWLPSVSASGAYSYDDVVNPPRAKSWSAALNISLPLFNGFSSVGKLKSARRDLDASRNSRKSTTQGILLQLKSSYYRALEEQDNVAAMKKKTEYLERNCDAMNAKFKEGLCSSTDMIDAETKKATGELQMQQALYSYAVAVNELEYALGGTP